MTNLDSIFKSKDITLPTKVQLVKAMVFPVVMYGCESWIIKIVECQRMMILNLVSVLEEIGPECSMEVLMLNLELQYFGHVMRKADSFDKTLMLGKIGQEEKGMTEDEMAGWHHQLNGCDFKQTLGDGKGQGSPACCSPWDHKELDRT